MSRALRHPQLYPVRESRNESIPEQSIVTAVHVVVAWLVAFICIAALALIA